MKNRKPVLMYDGTLLANMYSRSNSDRTGVFFVVWNLFQELMKQDTFEIILYSAESRLRDVRHVVTRYGHPDLAVLSDVKDGDCDIFLTPFAPPPSCVAENRKIARYMILHDITPLALPEIEAPNQEWFRNLEKSLNHKDRYIADSEYTRKDFLRFYPKLDCKKVSVAYLGASDLFYRCEDQAKISAVKRKYGIPENANYVFSFCTLQPRKNLIHAVKCFLNFLEADNVDDLYFVMGGGHWDSFIGMLDKELGALEKRKKFVIKTGYVDDEDVAALFSDALFTVYVSLYEGFGLPVLEAMQCGCPVITSNITSMPEVIGDCGITVDPRDPVALEAAYRRYYTDAEFRKNCGERGWKRSQEFSWKRFAEEILSKIQDTWEEDPFEETEGRDVAHEVAGSAKQLIDETYQQLSWEDVREIENHFELRMRALLAEMQQLFIQCPSLAWRDSSSVEEALQSMELYKTVMGAMDRKRFLQEEMKKADMILEELKEGK